MVFKTLREALDAHDPRFDYHYVRLFTGRWVRVEGEPVGITVQRLRKNFWRQITPDKGKVKVGNES